MNDPGKRELYIDAFRGLMALVMVQGHVTDTLLTAAAQAQPWYVFQQMFHGSTAPGFLFASGFVAGLPRAPLSLRASLRRARRLLFVLGVGYFLHLPLLLALEDGRRREPGRARGALRLRRAPGHRRDAALRARPAVGRRAALDPVGRRPRRRGDRGDPARLVVGCLRAPASGPRSLARRDARARASRSSRSRPSCWRGRSRGRPSAGPSRRGATGGRSRGGWASSPSGRSWPGLSPGGWTTGARRRPTSSCASAACCSCCAWSRRPPTRSCRAPAPSHSSATRRSSSTCCISTCSSVASSALAPHAVARPAGPGRSLRRPRPHAAGAARRRRGSGAPPSTARPTRRSSPSCS